jgi:hypothetical protein
MTYVSCSPYMVPVAWLAAAQAEVKEPRRPNTKKAVTVATRQRGKKR